MNKKGFTLIEIILSITIIAVIATLSIVTFTKKKDSTDKIKNTIIAAADVYYSTSKEIQEKVKNNGGFIVFSIEDLINNGVLDKNFTVTELENTLSEKAKNDGKTYEKIVFYYDISNLKEDKITTYDKYIYPYEKNKPFILNLEELKLEFDEVTNKDISDPEDNFNCRTDIETLYYLSKDYTKEELDNYECERNKIHNSREEKKTTNIDLPYSSDDIVLNDERKVTVYPKFNPKIVGTTTSNEIYECGNWSNKDITLKLQDNNNTNILDHNLSYEWSNKETNEEITITTSENINLNYSLKGKTKKLKDTEITAGELSCDVKIDKTSPTVEYDGDSFTIKDDDSGIKNLTITENNKVKVNNTYKADTKNIYYKYSKDNLINKNVSVIVEDNAGNEMYYTPNLDDLPSIKVEPIPNTYTKFKVMLKNYKNLNNINISYGFNEDYINNLKTYINKLNIGKVNYEYKNPDALNNKTFKDTYLNGNSRNIKTISADDIKLNNNNEYTFEIDMLDALYDCIGADKETETVNKNSKFLCESLENTIQKSFYPTVIKLREWFNNLKLDYYITLKNTNDKETVYKVTSQYNMYFDNKHQILTKSSINPLERVGIPSLVGYIYDGDTIFRVRKEEPIGNFETKEVDEYYYYYAEKNDSFLCKVEANDRMRNNNSFVNHIEKEQFSIISYEYQNGNNNEKRCQYTCNINGRASCNDVGNKIGIINSVSSNKYIKENYKNFKDIDELDDNASLKKFVKAQEIAYRRVYKNLGDGNRRPFVVSEEKLTKKVIKMTKNKKEYGRIYVVSSQYGSRTVETTNKDYMEFFFAPGVTTSVEYYSSN